MPLPLTTSVSYCHVISRFCAATPSSWATRALPCFAGSRTLVRRDGLNSAICDHLRMQATRPSMWWSIGQVITWISSTHLAASSVVSAMKSWTALSRKLRAD